MTKPITRVILFVNGDLPEPKRFKSLLNPSDFLVAVDGGLAHLHRLGLKPDLIIGDLDSADPNQVETLRADGTVVQSYPADKNETDLELALDAAIKMNPASIWVAAALGGRIDQTLANLFLLTRPDMAGMDIRLVDGECEVFLIRSSYEIKGKAGQRVSLLPILGPVHGIQTEGLKYPLNNESLYPEKTRGISNELTGSSASVLIQQGLLLCIHQITEPQERSGEK